MTKTDREYAKRHGAIMLHIGLLAFFTGAAFWLQSIYGYYWYQSLTVLGLVFFLLGWLKRLTANI